jgi:hypothetical protein
MRQMHTHTRTCWHPGGPTASRTVQTRTCVLLTWRVNKSYMICSPPLEFHRPCSVMPAASSILCGPQRCKRTSQGCACGLVGGGLVGSPLSCTARRKTPTHSEVVRVWLRPAASHERKAHGLLLVTACKTHHSQPANPCA